MEKHYFLIFVRILYILALGFAAYVAYQIEGTFSWAFWGVCGFVLIASLTLVTSIRLRRKTEKRQ
ncbi:MAG TPA: hypothetical protein VEY51_19055 [Chondromyces sp.]|nr:hypothetical protein [Chondromyces sp.]